MKMMALLPCVMYILNTAPLFLGGTLDTEFSYQLTSACPKSTAIQVVHSLLVQFLGTWPNIHSHLKCSPVCKVHVHSYTSLYVRIHFNCFFYSWQNFILHHERDLFVACIHFLLKQWILSSNVIE